MNYRRSGLECNQSATHVTRGRVSISGRSATHVVSKVGMTIEECNFRESSWNSLSRDMRRHRGKVGELFEILGTSARRKKGRRWFDEKRQTRSPVESSSYRLHQQAFLKARSRQMREPSSMKTILE